MKTRSHSPQKTLAGALTLAVLCVNGTMASLVPSHAVAQPQPDDAKAVNPPNRRAGARRANRANGVGKRMIEREVTRIEKASGKTLSAEQKTQVEKALIERVKATRAAQDEYLKAVAGATGVTTEELQMQLRAQRRRAAQDRTAAQKGG